MALPTPGRVSDPKTQRVIDRIAKQFPLAAEALQDGVVTTDKLDPGVYGDVGSISTIDPDDAAAAGTSETLARADHEHAIAAAAASTIDGTNAEGSASSFARSDHNHALPAWGTYFPHPAINDASSGHGVSNVMLYSQVRVLHDCTLTGVGYWVGSTQNGNVRSALYDSGGDRVANRTSNLAQAGINTFQGVSFDNTYDAAPGIYFAAIIFSSTTTTYRGGHSLAPSGFGVQGSFTTPSSISAPSTPANLSNALICSTY